MKLAGRLLLACWLLSVAGWARAPHARTGHKAVVHKLPPHAARRFSQREERERAQLRAEQRRQAKLAKKQRKEALRRSRKIEKTEGTVTH